jgi:hypothetical protein
MCRRCGRQAPYYVVSSFSTGARIVASAPVAKDGGPARLGRCNWNNAERSLGYTLSVARDDGVRDRMIGRQTLVERHRVTDEQAYGNPAATFLPGRGGATFPSHVLTTWEFDRFSRLRSCASRI